MLAKIDNRGGLLWAACKGFSPYIIICLFCNWLVLVVGVWWWRWPFGCQHSGGCLLG